MILPNKNQNNKIEDIEYIGYVVDQDDPEIEDILAYLLSQLVIITGFIIPPDNTELKLIQYGILCSDVFMPAADCEYINTVGELKEVYHIYRKGGMDNVFKWIKNRRENIKK